MQASSAFGVLLSGGSPIDLDGSMFVQMGIFFIAFLILRSLVFQPVMRVFDAREAAVGGAKREAESMEHDAHEKREHFEHEMRKVRAEANEKRDALRSETQAAAREITEKARTESANAVAAGKAKLDAEAAQASAAAQAQIPVLAKQITDKLLNRSVQG